MRQPPTPATDADNFTRVTTSDPRGSLCRRAALVLVIEARVTAIQGGFFFGNPESLYVGADVEDIAVGGEEGGYFAGFQGTEAVRYADDLGGINRYALEGFVCGQAEGYGLGREIRKIPRQRGVKGVGAGTESNLDTRVVQDLRGFEMYI